MMMSISGTSRASFTSSDFEMFPGRARHGKGRRPGRPSPWSEQGRHFLRRFHRFAEGHRLREGGDFRRFLSHEAEQADPDAVLDQHSIGRTSPALKAASSVLSRSSVALKTTLDETIGGRNPPRCAVRSMRARPAGLRSNSWLPRVTTSYPMSRMSLQLHRPLAADHVEQRAHQEIARSRRPAPGCRGPLSSS